MAGMTFAEAYLLRKKKEESEGGFKNKQENKNYSLITNFADMDETMHTITKDVAEDAKITSNNIRTVLKGISTFFAKHVTEWHDHDNLDLLHHLIINNKADLIGFIFVETMLFPLGYEPPCNPYAHLAAFLGHAECLKVILQHRPGAFFRIQKSEHAIKLPEAVLEKNRLKVAAQAVSKGAEKFLDKIRHSTFHAETMMQIFQSADARDSDITMALTNELGALDKKFETKCRLPSIMSSNDKKKDKVKTPKESRSEETCRLQARTRKDGIRLHKHFLIKFNKGKVVDTSDDHLQRRLNPLTEKHCYTIFWDTFSHFDERHGVVNRAGDPVRVHYALGAQRERANIDLDRLRLCDRSDSDSCSPFGNIPARKISRISEQRSSLSSYKSSDSKKRASNVVEHGVRGNKKFKEFHIKTKPQSQTIQKEKFEKHLNKTPLSYAAERGHIDCVYYLLETVVMKRNPSLGTKEPLTLATKARSPESIMLLLTIEKRVTSTDYLSAVMLSIREMYPECLISLLTNKGKSRHTVFDGTNLYHILFSQSVISSRRYELMPEMTRALVSSKEDVNAHGSPRTYPMYTLINCAFNITVGKQIFFFIDCLYILLECKANPHFDETRSLRAYSTTEKFTRQAYTSAISCVFESAKNSVNFFESTYWSNLFMKKFITTIEMHDLTPRRVLNNVLFDYMEAVCVLGLDRTIVRCLLRYGANPDFKKNDKYPVNVYFDQIFPYLTKFEIVDTSGYYKQELHTLMIIARSMSLHCQSEALSIFLTDHLLTAPIQALPISREFASLMGQMVRTPRPLLQLVINCIWVATKRNKKKVRDLPIPEVYMASIIP